MWIKFADTWPDDNFYWCRLLESEREGTVTKDELTICRVDRTVIHFIGMGEFSRRADIGARHEYDPIEIKR